MSGALVLLLAIVDGRRLAFPIETIAAVLPLPRLAQPPGAVPPPLIGFADVGGRATAVVAPIALLTGAPAPRPGIDAHLLLLARHDPPVALLVDRAAEIVTVERDQVRPLTASASATGWLTGTIGDGEATAHLVDGERLLAESERRRLTALAAALAARETAA